eukprot:6363218-Alexandrium_andersonii.AAC.1
MSEGWLRALCGCAFGGLLNRPLKFPALSWVGGGLLQPETGRVPRRRSGRRPGKGQELPRADRCLLHTDRGRIERPNCRKQHGANLGSSGHFRGAFARPRASEAARNRPKLPETALCVFGAVSELQNATLNASCWALWPLRSMVPPTQERSESQGV